jgi:hypothetical protein
MTRRDVLRAGCACAGAGVAGLSIGRASAAPRYFEGCFLTSDGYQKYRSHREGVYSITDGLMSRNRHFRTTGDSAMDRDLDRALGVIADLFGINPAFGFYDPSKFSAGEGESNRMNAFATMENTNVPGTQGTVGFGWDLFHTEFYQYDSSGMTIMAIVAHEFGHIVQGARGYLDDIRVGYPMKSEINADFLAGYFLGKRKQRMPALRFQQAGELFIRLGRGNEGDPTRTHGNSRERLDAAEAGFRAAYVRNMSLNDALRTGLEYVGYRL